MHGNAASANALGKLSVQPFFDFRQTALDHFNWMNDNNGADLEKATVPDFINCLAKQGFRLLKLPDQESCRREWFLCRYFALFPAFNVTQTK